jgi:hypothetical protein
MALYENPAGHEWQHHLNHILRKSHQTATTPSQAMATPVTFTNSNVAQMPMGVYQ